MIEIVSSKKLTRDSLIKGEITAEEFIDRYLNPDDIPRMNNNKKDYIEVLGITDAPDGMNEAFMSNHGLVLKGKLKDVSSFIRNAYEDKF